MMQLLGHIEHWIARLGGPRPLRDWLSIVVVTLLLFIGTVLWSVQLFQTVASGGVIDPRVEVRRDETGRAPSLTDNLRTLYKMRADEAAAYSAGVYVPADPSQ